MSEEKSIFIFTFGPVQPFIAEARRAGDLFAGSQILVKLARAVAEKIVDKNGQLIYPATLEQDVPNKIVALVSWKEVEKVASEAKKALLKAWSQEATSARNALCQVGRTFDPQWDAIWLRQTGLSPIPTQKDKQPLWECYWAAALLQSEKAAHYKKAYQQAERALDATKRTRNFVASEEMGEKDTLSGKRSALHLRGKSARVYWQRVAQSPKVKGSSLRPDGKERLDALGSVKRFGKIAQDERFPSVSSVATADFLQSARPHLSSYRLMIEQLMGKDLYKVNPKDKDWPYDGEFFFQEMLTAHHLEDNYNLKSLDPDLLQEAQRSLKQLYNLVGFPPSPYYAILVMDGDSMGAHISACLEEADPHAAHYALSDDLGKFTAKVKGIVEGEGRGRVIYAGGDDVLALFPLRSTIQTTQKLAEAYEKAFEGWEQEKMQEDGSCKPFPFTASAGLAIVHHFYPLDAALKAARQAEKRAKSVEGKNALAVRVLKRSGETNEIVSPWPALDSQFEELMKLFEDEALSTNFPHRVLGAIYGLPEPGEMFEAELKRLIERHRGANGQSLDAAAWAKRLNEWAEKEQATHSSQPEAIDSSDVTYMSTENLAKWLILARFVAQRGGE